MTDTLKLQSAPQCISGVAEVAAMLAGGDDAHTTHALEVTSYFPLDVETISRILESLEDRPGVELLQQDGLQLLYFEDPTAYNVRDVDFEAGEHLERNDSLMKNLVELSSDARWMRKVEAQHELLRIASGAKHSTLELSYFTARSTMPSAKIQSVLNDMGAGGQIAVTVDEGALHYTFPPFVYSKKRLKQNLDLLHELEPAEESKPIAALLVALLLVACVVTVLLIRG